MLTGFFIVQRSSRQNRPIPSQNFRDLSSLVYRQFCKFAIQKPHIPYIILIFHNPFSSFYNAIRTTFFRQKALLYQGVLKMSYAFLPQKMTSRHTRRRHDLRLIMTASVLLLAFSLSGCGTQTVSRECFAMDTVMTLSASGDQAEQALTEAEAELYRLDRLFSISSATGDIAQLNRSGSASVSDETGQLLTRALSFSEQTDGAFDPTIYPVAQLWGFYSGAFQVPSDTKLQAALKHVGWNRCHLDGSSVTLEEGTQLDLGAIAKGYASARVAQIIQNAGVSSANLSLGGNIHVVGSKPDGSDWKVAIADPDDPSDYAGILQVQDTAVVTSGGYQRYFEENGTVYHHILDPKTGYPARSSLNSVTVISQDDVLADALSTALFVMGPEQAADYWRQAEEAFEVIFLTDSHTILCSEGIADRFTPADRYTMEVIHR